MSIQPYEHRAELTQTSQDVAVHRLGEWAQSADAAYQVATRLSESAFVPQQFRGKPVETTAAILAGLEVGLSPMAAVRSFDIIQGTAAARAVTLRAIVQSHGHEIVLVESTDTRCRMKGKRKGSDEWQAVTWTIDRAKNLGLTGKDNWKKQPAAMLVARATSEIARLVASDAILGIAHSSEELADGAGVDDAPTVSAPSGTRRMSRPRPAQEQVDSATTAEQIPHEPSGADDAPDVAASVEPSATSAPESPLLDTKGKLAKRMFALMGDLGITDRDNRLVYVSDVVGRTVTSSSEMTDADAEQVIASLERDQQQPFAPTDTPLDES